MGQWLWSLAGTDAVLPGRAAQLARRSAEDIDEASYLPFLQPRRMRWKTSREGERRKETQVTNRRGRRGKRGLSGRQKRKKRPMAAFS